VTKCVKLKLVSVNSTFTRLFLLIGLTAGIISCNEKEDFTSDPLTDYFPLQVGKYITYRLDSTVFTNFQRNIEIHRYQEKHVVDQVFTDNQGRPAYKIYRYQRDSAGLGFWNAAGTYTLTVLSDQVEYNDDNLRVIKMHMPVRDGFSWKGNAFLATNPYNGIYNFSNDDNMADWDFYYDGGSSSFSYGGKNYTDVYTVESANEVFNIPVTDPAAFGTISRSVEKYSKSIGLVYREYTLYEYQPNTGGSGGGFYTGFGTRMWMIDHN
jgi:hypothetical protein